MEQLKRVIWEEPWLERNRTLRGESWESKNTVSLSYSLTSCRGELGVNSAEVYKPRDPG